MRLNGQTERLVNASDIVDFLRDEASRKEPLSVANMRILADRLDPRFDTRGRPRKDPPASLAWHAGNLRALFQYKQFPKNCECGETWKDFLSRWAEVSESTIDRAIKRHGHVYRMAYLYRTFRLWLDGEIKKVTIRGEIPRETVEAAVLFFPHEAAYHDGKMTDARASAIRDELKKVI